MDFDDNDFHSHNLHLAGEGSSKFPPVFRPYTVPKFDFDESLQGHLRFDSLVETEVFLGIESNEDNQWIDAYSRASSGIEFSSTVAESCSISRHTNVWSEATSSESVEMLLKSVGQEELIPREAVIQEPDACDELACLAKQMEPKPKSDEKNVFKDNVTELHPPSCILENLSGAKENVETKQSLPGVSQGHKGESSLDGSSNILKLPDIHRNIDLSESSGAPFADGKHDDDTSTNQKKIETPDDGSLGVKIINDLPASGVKTNITAASTQNISSSCEVLNIQNVQNQVAGMSDEQQSSLQKQTNTQDLESSVINKDSDVGTKVCMEETLESGSVVEDLENGISSLGKSLNIIYSGISNLQKADRGNQDTCLRNLSQGNASNNATSIEDDQSSLNTSDLAKIVIKDDSSSERHKVEVGNSDCGTCPNYQLNMVMTERTFGESSASKEKAVLNIGDQMDTEILFSKSEASMFDVVDKNSSTVSDENSDSRASNFFSINTVVSTNPCIFSETTQVCQINESDNQGDHKILCQDISVIVQESDEKAPFDLSPIHCAVDHSHLVDRGVCSPSLGAGSMETKLTTSTLSVDVTPANNSVTGHDEIQRMKLVGSASADVKEDSEAKIAEEIVVPLPVGTSEQGVDHCPVSGTEKQKNSDTSRQLSCETASSCLQNLGTPATEKIGEPQETLSDNKVDQQCTKEVSVAAVLCKSIEKQGDEATVSFIKDDKAIQEHHDKPCSKLSGYMSSSTDSHNELHETGGFPANPTINTCGPSVSFGSPPEGEKDENQVKPITQLNPTVSEFMNTDAKSTLSSDHDPMGDAVSKDERSLAPEVNPAANSFKKDETDLTTLGTNACERDPFPVTAANKESMVVEKSPLASRLGTPKANVAGHVSHESPQILNGDSARTVSKGTPERKTKRAYNKSVGKESSRKGSKGKTPARQSEKGGRSTNVSLSPPPRFQLVQSNEVQQYGKIDSISTKPFSLLNASTSSLPDLNTSASAPVLFQQPFIDIQQVQLRAQILVYGAFIQGTVPDEAHMISAFGGPDGGKSIWAKVWSSCMERHRGQKSHPVNSETPLQSRSGPITPDLAAKQSALQGKGISSPLGLASSKATPTVANPLIPLSSPLWNLPTPSRDSLQSSALARGSALDYSQALTLHPYQTPPMRNFLGHITPWISQAHPHGPGIASSTPALDNSSHHSASPVTHTIKSTSVKGSSVPSSSGIKNVQPALPASNTGLQSVSGATTPVIDTNIVTASHAQHSSDQKPKKRKKVTASEDLVQKAVHLQSPLVSTPVVSSHISTAVATSTPAGNVPITTFEKSVASASLSLADRLKSDWNVEKMIMSDESLRKIDEARISAEEASVLSAAAVNHSMEIWKQLDKQKNSGLASDIEAKLASAAVAVAAAAAVAKAAAAAANVASNAALQAKLMADEALAFSGHQSSCRVSLSEGMSILGKATPASILKGANETNGSGSIISAAKEAARRRVEAASADRKRAETLDAIVKAAELAAEAVSQAGKIVTMGDPLPLSVLVEAGPVGCWKTVQESSQLKGNRGLMNVDNVGDGPEASQICNNISSVEMGKQIAASEESPFRNGMSLDHMRSVDDISPIININENNPNGPKGHKVSDSVNPIDVLPESGNEIQPSFTIGNGSGYLEENNIKEGSLVEVFKDGEGFKGGWFTANILSLNDDKAYVCYSVLVADEGAGPLKEWVSVEGEGVKPPRIRVVRPLTGLHNEGTRKRRREIMVDYTWSIGDRVDAWIQESWQEGIITEKNKKDKTFTIHFPVSGETSAVGAWHLRPSLIWKDGKWIESPKVGANDSPTKEGDTPHEKRPKLGNPAGELVKGKEKILKGTDAAGLANRGESRLLNLAENDKVFNIGKTNKSENKPEGHRLVRSGLQKEGPRVIYGVPKPGKKRKFMEVSKHYVAAGTSKINDGSDSVKLANSLIPQGSGSRGWTNISKKDTIEKAGVDFKPTTKSGRLQSVSGRAVPPKGKTLTNSRTNDLTSRTERIKDSPNHFNNTSESENQIERSSISETTGVGAGPADSQPTKKPSTTRVSKGKLPPAGRRLVKVEMVKASNENPEKSVPEANEPRRSNRRIQPTSRLLEGLQSSLIISKIPSGAHEKGNKNQNRNTSRGNNRG